jgi:CRP/FNR family cyclic AMP-dependent transcriptional regulator
MVKELKNVKVPVFVSQAFLDSAGVARKVAEYRGSQKIYSQGDPATSVMYVQEGSVKLSVVDEIGKAAVLAIRGPVRYYGK